MSADAQRAIIVGGSVGGLSAAIMLRRQGWAVDVYERASEDLVNRGAGIATQDVLYEALKTAGVELREEMGVHSKERIMFDQDGSVLGTHTMAQTMTSWGMIYRFLKEQVPAENYHSGHSLVEIEHRSDGVRARFENGDTTDADWLVAADGPRSTVRQLLAPDVTLEYCGYFLWRGLIDETLIPAEVLEQIEHRLMFAMAPGGHSIGYFVAGRGDSLEPGTRWYNWGWYRTADFEILKDHLTDADGTYYAQGIPHDRIRPELAAIMREEARAYLSPQHRSVIDATERPFLQGIYDGGCDRMIFDRSVIIGDAAFTARPHVGMGVCKAIYDAATLATALIAPDQQAACAHWEQERLRYGQAVLQWGRDMGSYIGPEPTDEAGRAKAAYYQQPEVLMSESAAINPSVFLGLEPA